MLLLIMLIYKEFNIRESNFIFTKENNFILKYIAYK